MEQNQTYVDLGVGLTPSLTEAFAEAMVETEDAPGQRALARVARRVAEQFVADLTIEFEDEDASHFFDQIGLTSKGFLR